MTLITTVPGDPASVRSAVDWMRQLLAQLGDTTADLAGAGPESVGWQGRCATAYGNRLDSTRTAVVRQRELLAALTSALDSFATDLATVQDRCGAARTAAAAAGLPVTPDAIHPPVQPTGSATAAWESARAEVAEARTLEERAHQELHGAVAASTGDAAVTDLLQNLGMAPTDFADGVDATLFTMSVGPTAGKAGIDLLFGRPASLDPRVPYTYTQLRVSPRGMTLWQRARLMAGRDSWREPAHLRPDAVRSNALRFGRVLGPVGSTAAALGSGYDQWQQDADDPRYGRTERLARAGAVTAGSGGGGAAGGATGAWAGAVLGSLAGPVGTGVGAAVGGVAGGALGGWGGTKLADVSKDWVGDRAEEAEDLTTEIAHDLEDAATDLGEGLEDSAGRLREYVETKSLAYAGGILSLAHEAAEHADDLIPTIDDYPPFTPR